MVLASVSQVNIDHINEQSDDSEHRKCVPPVVYVPVASVTSFQNILKYNELNEMNLFNIACSKKINPISTFADHQEVLNIFCYLAHNSRHIQIYNSAVIHIQQYFNAHISDGIIVNKNMGFQGEKFNPIILSLKVINVQIEFDRMLNDIKQNTEQVINLSYPTHKNARTTMCIKNTIQYLEKNHVSILSVFHQCVISPSILVEITNIDTLQCLKKQKCLITDNFSKENIKKASDFLTVSYLSKTDSNNLWLTIGYSNNCLSKNFLKSFKKMNYFHNLISHQNKILDSQLNLLPDVFHGSLSYQNQTFERIKNLQLLNHKILAILEFFMDQTIHVFNESQIFKKYVSSDLNPYLPL